mgnify:CR=1 FL=1
MQVSVVVVEGLAWQLLQQQLALGRELEVSVVRMAQELAQREQ